MDKNGFTEHNEIMIELKTKNCEICGKEFFNRRKKGGSLGDSQFLKSRFCSSACSGKHQIGISKPPHTKKWREEASRRLKKQHLLGLRKGIFTNEIRKKMSESRIRGFKDGHIIVWNKGNKSFDSKKYAREYMQKRINSDPIFKLHTRIRTRMHHYFRGSKPRRTSELLGGVDMTIVKAHIESQFQEGMSWENYGKWHVDHIIPLSSAKTFEQALKLWNYTNLQPLWAHENLIKSDKILIKVAGTKK